MMELTSNSPSTLQMPSFWKRLSWFDWLYALACVAGAVFAFERYGSYMDVYERGILVGATGVVVWLGWAWKPVRLLMVFFAVLALAAIGAYGSDLARADKVFWLKYFLSSQSAILWMSALFFLATITYWIGALAPQQNGQNTALWMGSAFTWAAVVMGGTGMLVRWYESYLIGADVGHVPVSNLYEVFILFSLITALFYLYYEGRYATRQLGGFVLLVISAAVGFLLWYTFARQAQEIQPLVPALQSWWMKIHVPANFIGYGTFSLAAMVAFAYLVKLHGQTVSWTKLAPLFVLGVLLAAEPLVFRQSAISDYWAIYFGVGAILAGSILALRGRLAPRLPSLEVLDDLIYKAIAVGFAFFTVATILGALWAADAWGAYWQWDPKETWALVVWLNYAAWLHMRLIKGLRGAPAAYWALIGLLITGFAFLGVNMFLSGLHSYGQL